MKPWLAVAIGALVLAAHMFRYEVTPGTAGGSNSTVASGYVLDRWTGSFRVLIGVRIEPVRERESPPM